jgi:ABC-type sugar transport system substrate-binding protein
MIAFLLLAEVAATTMPMPAFLSGCWEQKRDDGRWTEECWTDPRGGLMIGSGRAGQDDQVRHWEWMRIERGADGMVTFYGSPKGAPAVGFKATEADGESITFVNSSHDYPQRVRYVATDIGLDAEVSLADGSKSERWSYKRTAGVAK